MWFTYYLVDDDDDDDAAASVPGDRLLYFLVVVGGEDVGEDASALARALLCFASLPAALADAAGGGWGGERRG